MRQRQSSLFGAFGSRRALLIGAGGIAAGAAIAAFMQAAPAVASEEMVVYKTPACGCCGAWAKHVMDAGLKVRIVNQYDLSPVRERLLAPLDLASCHIALIDGYVVEGHVPASAIKKLLSEKPAAVGIFAPGMPLGSPGMDSPHGSDPFDVILLRRDGSREVFARFGA